VGSWYVGGGGVGGGCWLIRLVKLLENENL